MRCADLAIGATNAGGSEEALGSVLVNLALEASAEAAAGFLQAVVCLQLHPEALGRTELAGQTQRGICRHGACAVDDLVDAARWHADVARQPVLADAEGTKELFEEHLARMHVAQLCHGQFRS